MDSYFVTPTYLTWLRYNIGTVVNFDDVLSFPYPTDMQDLIDGRGAERLGQRLIESVVKNIRTV